MAKLYYYYGAMGSSKTANALMTKFNYEEKGHHVWLITPDLDNRDDYTDENGKKWVLSGDLGYQDDDGFFFFSGRKKRLIIIAGYNVYPTDIERVVGEFPEINECCAVQGWDNGRSMVRLYVSLHDKNADREALKVKISETLENEFSKFYVPRDFVFMDDLPQTPLMKIDFMKLSDPVPQ